MPNLASSFGMDNGCLPLLLLSFLPSQPASFVFCISPAFLNCHHAKENERQLISHPDFRFAPRSNPWQPFVCSLHAADWTLVISFSWASQAEPLSLFREKTLNWGDVQGLSRPQPDDLRKKRPNSSECQFSSCHLTK